MKGSNLLKAWSPSFVIMVIIYYLSNQSEKKLDSWLPLFQYFQPLLNNFNWAHFVAYFILSCTYYIALAPKFSMFKSKLISVVLCVIYGATDEIHQSFVPGRMPDIMDVRNDTIGAILAMFFLSIPIVHRLVKKWSSTINY